MALKQYLQFKLSQKLSPQQIQLMKLIQLPTQAFEQRLKQELEENPALDTGKEASDSIDTEFESEYDDSGTDKIDAGYEFRFVDIEKTLDHLINYNL